MAQQELRKPFALHALEGGLEGEDLESGGRAGDGAAV